MDVSTQNMPVPGLPDVGDAPAPELLFKRRIHFAASLRELWRSREVARSLTERGLRTRYKQTVFGVAWAMITPLTLMVVFTVFFKRVADDRHGRRAVRALLLRRPAAVDVLLQRRSAAARRPSSPTPRC